ncbi:MAG: hypothetical protein QNK35_00650 [Bacteroides sp.]|nr:hypothetical protein [Bacteroides sp.]
MEDFTFRKVKYYSILIEGSEKTEFEDFLSRMEEESKYEEDVVNLFTWLKLIGEHEGAKQKFFRPEGTISDAMALPPRASIMKSNVLLVNSLRLYCQRLNEHVVILFNGGIKTAAKAQDCPNVSAHFKQANRVAKQINDLFIEKEIIWNDSYSDIHFNKDLTMEL